MIKVKFVRGSSYIDVIIKGRALSFITPMLNFQPITIDLDKLNEQKEKIKKMNIDEKTLKELSNLKTEVEMFQDIKKDLYKSGWRVFKCQ